MIEQRERIASYFGRRYRSSMDRFPTSGLSLAERVRELEPRFVVDAGCGYNEFRGRIRNCIGIDLVNPNADLVCGFAEAPIKEGSIDVVLALGSINFGDEEDVTADLEVVSSWLVPGGRMFMRANPGEPLDDPSIVVYPWSPKAIHRIGERVGLEVASEIVEEHIQAPWGVPARRLFWIYEKTARSSRSRSETATRSARLERVPL
jgi:hypothetical protein